MLLYGTGNLAQRRRVNSKRFGKLGRWGLLMGLCSVVWAAEFVELDTESGLSEQYLKARWRSDDGLPDEIVTALAQTPDGFIWGGTFNGLARFDGIHFKVFNSANTAELQSNRILSLFVDQSARLWICSEFGRVARLSPSGFRKFGVEDGLPAGVVKEFFQEANGQLWGMQHGALSNYFRVNGDRFVPVHDTMSFDQRIRPPRQAKTDDFGNIWHPSWKEGLRIERKGELRTVRYEERSGPEAIRDLMMDMDGNVWVATDTSGLFCFKKRLIGAPNKSLDGGDQMVRSITGDSRGNVWFCSGKSVDRISVEAGKMMASRAVSAIWTDHGVCSRIGMIRFG